MVRGICGSGNCESSPFNNLNDDTVFACPLGIGYGTVLEVCRRVKEEHCSRSGESGDN